jgi:hypothetical protein
MISVISPAKTLDFESKAPTEKFSQPIFVEESEKIISKLRRTSRKKISSMMDISKNLTDLNFERYNSWEPRFNLENSKQAIYAFKGDVYLGFEAESLASEDINFAQDHLRILSGLHGILKPLDLIQPYRLEMGTKLKVGRRENLYQFWQDKIYKTLNEAIKDSGSNTLLNLASNEYFDSIDTKKLKAEIVKVDFKDFKSGQYKVLSFFAKKARGMMAKYIAQNKINDIDSVKSFNEEGYIYSPEHSTDSKLVFLRA